MQVQEKVGLMLHWYLYTLVASMVYPVQVACAIATSCCRWDKKNVKIDTDISIPFYGLIMRARKER
jgi:hypothetical protein